MVSLQKFSNLIDLITYFKDDMTYRNYLEQIRWNGKFVFRYNTIDLSESVRFDKMLNNIATTLSYYKLTKNETKPEFNPTTNPANAYKWLEAKQGSFEF